MDSKLDISNYEVSSEVSENESHKILIRTDQSNRDVYFECSSRDALFEFAKSLMNEALYGKGWAEFYPLEFKGKWLVVDGVRLSENSSRLFVSYPEKKDNQ